jgi:hypothetical protein
MGGTAWSGDVAISDFDEDGDLDVFVANMFGRSRMYANDGKGAFAPMADALDRPSWGTVGTRVFDADGDGRLDLFLVDMHSDMWMEPTYAPTEAEARTKYASPWGPMVERGERPPEQEELFARTFDAAPEHVRFGNTLYRSLGGGRFEEASDRAGLETLWPWGATTGDFDGDGLEDVFLPSGMGYPFVWWRSPLFVNRGDGTFVERTAEFGLDPPPGGRLLEHEIGGKEATRSARSAATADFDRDGRLDLVVNRFNDRPLLLMNRGPRRHHLALRLRDARGGDALGAVVHLRVGSRDLVREVSPTGGYLAQSSRTLHFGLGDATSVGECRIRWPSGKTQRLESLAIDRLHVVDEPK